MSDDPFASAPTGTVTGIVFYSECHHRWWTRLGDRLRRRNHAERHFMWAPWRPTDDEGAPLELELDADTITVRITSDGRAIIDD